MKSLYIYALILGLFALAIPAQADDTAAATWTVDKQRSSIAVSGTHADAEFSLVFADYNISIAFDPTNLKAASITAELNVTTAETGNMMYDGTLPKAEWLDSEKFPKAMFSSSDIRAVDGGYEAHGKITIKGKELPHVLAFNLSPDGDAMHATATTELDRFQLDVGMESDPSANWVSQILTLTLDIYASQK